jgi:hypothetical protein
MVCHTYYHLLGFRHHFVIFQIGVKQTAIFATGIVDQNASRGLRRTPLIDCLTANLRPLTSAKIMTSVTIVTNPRQREGF